MKTTIILAALALTAAACGTSAPAKPPTVTPTPTPSMQWDIYGAMACHVAIKYPDANPTLLGGATLMPALQDQILRAKQLGNPNIVRAWCIQHPPPTGSICDWGIGTFDGRTMITKENCQDHEPPQN